MAFTGLTHPEQAEMVELQPMRSLQEHSFSSKPFKRPTDRHEVMVVQSLTSAAQDRQA